MNSDNVTVSGLYITQKLKQSLPVDDLMAWLIKEHPDANLQQILSMLNFIYQEGFHIVPASEEKRTYQVGDRELNAFPQRVTLMVNSE
jgi:hypothetical protein